MAVTSTELDEVDLLVIVGISTGMTQEQAGAWVCTPSLPTGITPRAIRARMQAKKAHYERLITQITGRIRQTQQQFEDITKEQYKAKLEKLRSKGIQAKEKALDAGIDGTGDLALAVKVADSIEDRDFGKVSQVHKHEGAVDVNHKMVWQPERVLIQQEHDIQDSARLLSGLPSEVLEAEVLDSH